MSRKEWIVVHFIKENVVEAVPVIWMQHDLCYWPPYSGKKLIHAIAVCEEPIFGVWALFQVRKLGDGCTYNDLVKARAKACTAEDTSDLASDIEGKRLRKKKKHFDDADELQDTLTNESSSDDEVIHSTDFPPLDSNNTEKDVNKSMSPELPSCNIVHQEKRKSFDTNLEEHVNKKKNTSLLISTNDAQNVSFTEMSNNEFGHSSTHSFVVPDHTDKDTSVRISSKALEISARKMILGNSNKENIVKPVSVSNNIYKSQKSIVTKSKHNTVDNTPNINETSEKEFKRQILRQLYIINIKQTQISEDVQLILRNMKNQDDNILIRDDENSIFKKFNFPLKDISELDAVEEHLADENNTNMLVIELSKIGGATYKQTVKRIMSQLFSDEIAEQYSWIGFKGKKNFSLLLISTAIINAVQKTHKDITLSNIEIAMKTWLVKAKSRNTK